ncbi:hypothetical protein [Pseudodesulfovibrio tunisiensis]|uniref:hypothetical protein n=1 Tax=Pseudodesulfovibrio tunisiensis TaxID=463192 RepID=UPI001FB42271|nr:hypothetical protein [Pseudodesulfovibrio tunisiensis]
MSANPICHCFGYSEADIVRDVKQGRGRSGIYERILEEKRAGRCRCAELNPSGR